MQLTRLFADSKCCKFLQAADKVISQPVQQLELWSLDHVFGFPDGELGFGPKKVLLLQLPLFALAHAAWEPVLPAAMTVILFTMVPLVVLKKLFPRKRPVIQPPPAKGQRRVDIRSWHIPTTTVSPVAALGCVGVLRRFFRRGLVTWYGTHSFRSRCLCESISTAIGFQTQWLVLSSAFSSRSLCSVRLGVI